VFRRAGAARQARRLVAVGVGEGGVLPFHSRAGNADRRGLAANVSGERVGVLGAGRGDPDFFRKPVLAGSDRSADPGCDYADRRGIVHCRMGAAGGGFYWGGGENVESSLHTKFEIVRHAVATLAYRGGKTLRGAPPEFSQFLASAGTRTPGEILAHVCDLFDWALTMANGAPQWHSKAPQTWEQDSARFFGGLETLER